jgi:hypothetical protein
LKFETGDAHIGSNVVPLDPSTIKSEVLYGLESGNYTYQQNGTAEVYSQLYPYEGLFNYTSGIIHHVRLDGMIFIINYFTKSTGAVLLTFLPFFFWHQTPAGLLLSCNLQLCT